MPARKKIWQCVSCGKKPLTRNEMGICQKLLGQEESMRYCISCLAEYLDVSQRAIEDKIAEFKDQGCTLFSKTGK